MTPAAADPDRLIVLVPVYKPRLDALEDFSLRHSLRQLTPGRRVALLAPQSLDLTAYAGYAADCPGLHVVRAPDAFFGSIKGYNLLLLDEAFYARFAANEFMLILQTDALVLRDELDAWMTRGHDYVGAPWPQALEIRVELDRYAGAPRAVRTHVGNGGFSLRRTAACIALLREFPQARDYFLKSGSSEDLFFAFMGAVSQRFTMPTEAEAARFALELQPRRYHHLNGGQPPMGGHAWWKYEPGWWLQQLPPAAAAQAALLLAAAAVPGSDPSPAAISPDPAPAEFLASV